MRKHFYRHRIDMSIYLSRISCMLKIRNKSKTVRSVRNISLVTRSCLLFVFRKLKIGFGAFGKAIEVEMKEYTVIAS